MSDTLAQEFLKASPRGEGCGFAVLAIKAGNRRVRICLTVLPKAWAPATSADLATTIDLSALETEQADRLDVVVYEKRRVRVTGPEKTVRDFVRGLTGLKFDQTDSATDRSPVRLFDPTARCQSQPLQFSSEREEQVRAFWSMMTDVQFSSLIKPPQSVEGDRHAETYIAEKLMPHVAALEPLVQRAFVRHAEDFVRRRRPEFRHHIDEMNVVRGRIITSALASRAAKGQQAVSCQFDELDADSPWQQVIRFAARMVARRDGHEDEQLAGRAARIDRLLADCHVLHPRVARQMCSGRKLTAPRKARFAAEPLELARWLILARYPYGIQEDFSGRPPAVAAGVRVATSKLWELLLAGVKVKRVGMLQQHSTLVKIRQTAVIDKSPDLCAKDERGEFVAWYDAKYKIIGRPRFENMPMGDQYQQYAYAAATGKPTVFVYVGDTREPRTPREDVILVNGEGGTRIGVATVPFPRPEECRDITAWRQSVGERLGFTETFSRADDRG